MSCSRLRSGLAVCALAACTAAALPSSAAGHFDDPLVTPAQLSPLALRSRMMSVAAIGEQQAVAAGPRGQVFVSPDQGRTWRQIAFPESSDLVQVRRSPSGEVWVAGHDGILMRSADGGQNWQKVLDGNDIARRVGEVYATSPDEALRALGERWRKEGADKPIFDVVFADAQHGFAVGAFGLLMATADGGRSWQPWIDKIDNPKYRHIYAASWTGREVVLAGEQGLLARWTPGDDRFRALPSPYRGTFFGLQTLGEVWIAHGMQGQVWRTRDGGANWKQVPLGSNASVVAGDCAPSGHCVFGAQDGSLWHLRPEADAAQRLTAQSPGVAFGLALIGNGNGNGNDGRLLLAGTAGLNSERVGLR